MVAPQKENPRPSLPAELPVFPLTGSLLLPGNWLPLNVFEPRYRNMVEDALGRRPSERWIGMIQPRVPRQDNWPALEAPPSNPELYTVGCAGLVERCEPQPDGRYLILLKGYSRFRVRRELPRERGYRRVAADYSEFAADLGELEMDLDPTGLLQAVRAFGKAHGLELDLDLLASLPGVALLNGLAVALPFQPAEKQALLEAAGPRERQQLLLALISMTVGPLDAADSYAPPTVH